MFAAAMMAFLLGAGPPPFRNSAMASLANIWHHPLRCGQAPNRLPCCSWALMPARMKPVLRSDTIMVAQFDPQAKQVSLFHPVICG